MKINCKLDFPRIKCSNANKCYIISREFIERGTTAYLSFDYFVFVQLTGLNWYHLQEPLAQQHYQELYCYSQKRCPNNP